jgi:hypothetical protein
LAHLCSWLAGDVEKEELRYVSEPASTLIPSGPNTEVKAVLKDLAKKSRD